MFFCPISYDIHATSLHTKFMYSWPNVYMLNCWWKRGVYHWKSDLLPLIVVKGGGVYDSSFISMSYPTNLSLPGPLIH